MHTVSRPIAHPASFQVRRWTMPKRLAVSGQASESILDVDRIVVPVHQGMHWVCAVIDLQQRKFIYYDSLKVYLVFTAMALCARGSGARPKQHACHSA